MEYRIKFNKLIHYLYNHGLLLIVVFLLIIIFCKNLKINSLQNKLLNKPTIEYLYKDSIQTITDSIPIPVNIVKYKTNTIIKTDSIFIKTVDTVEILNKYHEIKSYNDVLKDDSTAYIELYEEVYKNSIQNRQLTFINKSPIVHINNKIPEKTLSIIGGLDTNMGINYNSLNMCLGIKSTKNNIYMVKYDVINHAYGCFIGIPLINFKL